MDDVVSTRMRSATLLFMLIWTKSPNVILDQTSTRVDNSLISPQKTMVLSLVSSIGRVRNTNKNTKRFLLKRSSLYYSARKKSWGVYLLGVWREQNLLSFGWEFVDNISGEQFGLRVLLWLTRKTRQQILKKNTWGNDKSKKKVEKRACRCNSRIRHWGDVNLLPLQGSFHASVCLVPSSFAFLPNNHKRQISTWPRHDLYLECVVTLCIPTI